MEKTSQGLLQRVLMRIASKSTVPAQADGISAGILLRNVKKKIHITKKNISKLLMNSDHYNYKSVDRLEYQKFIKFLDNTTNDLYIIPKWVNYSNASSGSRCSSTDKGNQQVTFKNWEPFTKFISKINNMQVDNE